MEKKNDYCLSCGSDLNADDRYCPHCGLETVYRNLSLRFLVRSFFEAFLNFDVKMLHSLRDIWIPNKITKTFLEGKREYHVHPFRFYFICLIIFFTLLSFLIKNWDFEDFELKESISKYELYHKLDTLSTHYTAQCEPGTWDSLKLQLYRGSKDLDIDTFFDLELLGTDFATFGISTLDSSLINFRLPFINRVPFRRPAPQTSPPIQTFSRSSATFFAGTTKKQSCLVLTRHFLFRNQKYSWILGWIQVIDHHCKVKSMDLNEERNMQD